MEAVRKAIKREKPDAILIAGDHVLNGPSPVEVVDALRAMESDGALIVQGNTDVAVVDADYSAAFPWYADGGVPESVRAAAEWANAELGDERLDWLRRLPSERRLRVDDTLILVTHASPGSQTQGFAKDLDPSAVLELMARTDARLICCGHTHVPDIREFGWKTIVNAGSAGYVFDGEPTASWALITIEPGTTATDADAAGAAADAAAAATDADAEGGEADADEGGEADGATAASITADIRRAEFDVLAVSNAISARGLPGDVYRAATVRTGKLVR